MDIKKFDAIIILNTPFNDKKNILDKLANIPIIAADGAANDINNLQIEAIIGDIDSLNINIKENKKYNIIQINDQNLYDFEKAINYAINKKCKNCVILGLTGGLDEHSINNWSILIKYSQKINLYPYSNNRIGIFFNNDIQFAANKDEVISIIPVNKLSLRTEGLKWCPNFLKLGKKQGARNQATQNKITITNVKGSGFIFIDANLPFVPTINTINS